MVAKTRSQDSVLFLGQPGLAVLSSWVRLLSLASRSFPESNPRVELDQVGSSLTPRGPHQRYEDFGGSQDTLHPLLLYPKHFIICLHPCGCCGAGRGGSCTVRPGSREDCAPGLQLKP